VSKINEINLPKVEIKEVPFDIPLSSPIQWGKDNDSIDKVTIENKLKAKHLKNVNTSSISFGDMNMLCSKMTGRPLAFIEELDMEDVMKLYGVVNHFLLGGRQIGEA